MGVFTLLLNILHVFCNFCVYCNLNREIIIITYLYSAYNKSSKRFTIKLILESQYKTIYKKIRGCTVYIHINILQIIIIIYSNVE